MAPTVGRSAEGGSRAAKDAYTASGTLRKRSAKQANVSTRIRLTVASISAQRSTSSAREDGVDSAVGVARVGTVQVVLRKLGRGSRAVTGRLVRAPRKGSVVVIEFSDGMHEYVTTPVKRVLRLAPKDVFYIETVNSRYRLEVRDPESALEDASSG